MTQDMPESTSSDVTDGSKPWPDVVRLGQRILNDLDPGDQSDTLGRWMAHRIAELIERAESASDAVSREAARRECTDLIMRLWEHRASRSRGRPLSEIASFLAQISDGYSTRARAMTQMPETTWLGLMQRLEALSARETQICFDAGVTDVDIEQERVWLEEHGDDISDDERRTITAIIERHDGAEREYYRLDGMHIPNFAGLPAHERFTHALEALKRLDEERRALLDVFRGRDPSAAADIVDGVHTDVAND